MSRANHGILLGSAVAVMALLSSCSGTKPSEGSLASSVKGGSIPLPTMADDKGQDHPGVHNLVAFHPGYVSGSVPEGDEGFATLRAMGFKTIISVDGAMPDVERAAAYGLRYIHLPIGYNGFDEERKLQLARASRDALRSGPVYVHCHHGKHRSAGAAATVAASLGWETPEEGVSRMKVAGTSPTYTGLYACAANATVLPTAMVNKVPTNFPSRWKPSGYVQGMVDIDEVYEHLKAIEKAGWVTPRDHPDLVPVAEAGRLSDLYRVLTDTDYVNRKPAELAEMMRESQARAQRLEDMLAAGGYESQSLSEQFRFITASCKECHVKFRD